MGHRVGFKKDQPRHFPGLFQGALVLYSIKFAIAALNNQFYALLTD